MSSFSEAKRKYLLDTWAGRVRECQGSGKTVLAWCAENKINSKTYYRWKKLAEEAAYDALPVECKIQVLHPMEQETKSDFAEVSLSGASAMSGSTAVTIRVDGIMLEIRDGASQSVIENTLRAIRRSC